MFYLTGKLMQCLKRGQTGEQPRSRQCTPGLVHTGTPTYIRISSIEELLSSIMKE